MVLILSVEHKEEVVKQVVFLVLLFLLVQEVLVDPNHNLLYPLKSFSRVKEFFRKHLTLSMLALLQPKGYVREQVKQDLAILQTSLHRNCQRHLNHL